MKAKYKTSEFDNLKAAKAANRNEEIAYHGKSINYANVVRSKKTYTRKQKHKVNYGLS